MNLPKPISRLARHWLGVALLIVITPTRLVAQDDALIHFQKGQALQQSGQYEEAATAYRQALIRNPKLLPAQFSLASVYTLLKRYPEAIEALQRVLELDAYLPEAHAALGGIYLTQMEYRPAIAAFERALQLNPELDIREPLAFSYEQLGRAEQAAAVRKAAGIVTSPTAEQLYVRGVKASRAGQVEAALQALQQAIALDAKLFVAQRALGNLYAMLKRHEEAAAFYRQAVALNPADAAAQYDLGVALYYGKKLAESAAPLARAVKLAPEEWAYPTLLSQVYVKLERYDAAWETLREMAVRHPNRTVAAYQAALKLKPDLPQARYELALLYLRLGNRTAAEQQHAELIKLDSALAAKLAEQLKEETRQNE